MRRRNKGRALISPAGTVAEGFDKSNPAPGLFSVDKLEEDDLHEEAAQLVHGVAQRMFGSVDLKVELRRYNLKRGLPPDTSILYDSGAQKSRL